MIHETWGIGTSYVMSSDQQVVIGTHRHAIPLPAAPAELYPNGWSRTPCGKVAYLTVVFGQYPLAWDDGAEVCLICNQAVQENRREF